NGQKARQDLFRHLLQSCRSAAIIETEMFFANPYFRVWASIEYTRSRFQVITGTATTNYGGGTALIRECIATLVSQFELAEFFPRSPSAVETGGRRGCIVVTQHPSLIDALEESSRFCGDGKPSTRRLALIPRFADFGRCRRSGGQSAMIVA